MITFRSVVTFILLVSCVCITFGQDFENNSSMLTELELAKRDAKDFKNLASLIKPSVVVIESVDRNGYEGGRGTGFVVREDGVIATNFHVIGEHRDFSIRFSDAVSYTHLTLPTNREV